MGLFSKKNELGIAKPADAIFCDKIIKAPPERYPVPEGIPRITKDQHEKYIYVLEHFRNGDLLLPVKSGRSEKSNKKLELFPSEKLWLTRECILRYLRATNWDVNAAISRLRKTLIWRREFKLSNEDSAEGNIDAGIVEHENLTGKQVLLGYTPERSPIFMMKNGRQNTEPSFGQVQHLVFFMESCITMMPESVERIALLIDYKHYKDPGIISAKSPPISLSRQILNIIQDHYPERLGKALFVNMPWYGWTFLKLMHPFIDPITRSKLVYDEPLLNHVDEDQLEVNYGGKLDFVYNHEVYWPDLVSTVQERRSHQYKRFLKFGACVGLSEFDLKGNHNDLRYPAEHESIL